MTEPPHDSVRVSAYVAVAPAAAFAIFTEEIDGWWRRGPRFRAGGQAPGALHMETRLGGRIFEAYDADRLHEVGVVVAWQPPEHFAFTWRSITFTRGETTRVDVRFAPRGAGTEVRLEHSGWAQIPDDHPVRHGEIGSAFLTRMGRWWADLLTSLREHAGDRPGAP
jgi:hypothetical protein